jgi:hypothetical protein
MSGTPNAERDDGLRRSDRGRALALIFKYHGRQFLKPTVPTRVEIFRLRTGMIEAWEIVAWVPVTSEYLAWRRDTNQDNRLKSKGFYLEDFMDYETISVPLAEEWDVEPIEDDEEAADGESDGDSGEDAPNGPDPEHGLTLPNSSQLKKYRD